MDVNPVEEVSEDVFVQGIIVQSLSNKSISLPITLETKNTENPSSALVDSGAEGLFVSQNIASKWK